MSQLGACLGMQMNNNNSVVDSVLNEGDLPIKFLEYTPCSVITTYLCPNKINIHDHPLAETINAYIPLDPRVRSFSRFSAFWECFASAEVKWVCYAEIMKVRGLPAEVLI